MTTTNEGGQTSENSSRDRPARGGDLPFQALCRTARALLEVPVATLALDGEAEGWIDLREGVDAQDWTFAAAAEPRPCGDDPSAMVASVPHHKSCAGYLSVEGAPPLHVVASAPIRAGGSGPDGRLTLFDTLPRRLDAGQMRRLEDLAEIAATCLRLYREERSTAGREAHYRLLAESSTDTIVRGNLDGVRLYISPAVRTLLGYEPEELVGRRAQEITHPDDLEAFRALMAQVRDGALELAVSEQRQRHKNGSWVWLEASIRLTRDAVTGEPDGYVASVRDISRRKAAEAQLLHIAHHDELTGLPNRKLFGERLEGEIARAWRTGQGFALFCIDIDRFKQVNDTYGHGAGDALLRAAAQRFRASVRGGDVVARLGGDEFALIQIGGDRTSAITLAERLIAALAQPLRHEGQSISAGISIGITCARVPVLNPDRLMAAADEALYRAKSEGRRTYRFSTAGAPVPPVPDQSASGM
ncbi:diguanylate cyclase [Ancylobacter sp. A5.8]|uniref:diguanylate cyclase domain-containing protein n=1 Tax=Ancylobacter gelatini TaxID=2919920 RepID=UPI001F4D590F|nr:diguanylate cyclase [Ancylobacter gelatini]MCJ8144557.1 diguanylate cyclase [Ancylobacter gelatini]